MTTLMSLLVNLGISSEEFDKGITDAEKKATNFSKDLGKGMQNVGGGMMAVGAGLTAGITAPIIAGLAGAIKGAMDAEAVMAELDAVLLSTGGAAGVTKDSLLAQADALSKVTKFDDEAILAGQSMLLTFTNIGKDVFPDTTVAMLNMAEKFGSVDAAATQLGKAMNDPVEGAAALRRVGVALSDDQEQQIKDFMAVGDIASAQGVILQELGTEFGGLAEAAGATTEGKLTIMQNQLADMGEDIGANLLPVVLELAGMLSEFLSDPAVMESIKALALSFGEIAVSIAQDIMPKAKEFLDWLTNLGQDGQAKFGLLAAAIAILGPILVVVGGAIGAIGTIIAAVGLPIFALIAAIGLLIGVIIAFGKQAWTTFTQILGIIVGVFLIAWNAVKKFFTDLWDGMVDVWKKIVDKVKTTVSDIKAAFAIDWLSIGKNVIEGIKKGIENGIGALKDAVRGAAQAALDAAKDLLGIQSPSTVFAGIGKNMMLGMSEGIDRYKNIPIDMTATVAGRVMPDGNNYSTMEFSTPTAREIGKAVAEAMMQIGFAQ